jgi:hypothetical protein
VKYLQILHAGIVIAGAMMALNLAVVCLLYAVNVDTEPRLADQLPRLFALTGLFAALGGSGVGAFLAHRRAWPARWVLQALPVAPVLGLAAFLAGLRS